MIAKFLTITLMMTMAGLFLFNCERQSRDTEATITEQQAAEEEAAEEEVAEAEVAKKMTKKATKDKKSSISKEKTAKKATRKTNKKANKKANNRKVLILDNVDNVDDSESDVLRLAGAIGAATAQVGGNTYLFVAGFLDNGMSVFAVNEGGSLANVFNIGDTGLGDTLELSGANDIATAQVGGRTYLFVAGFLDDGFSVFVVRDNGSLVSVANVSDQQNEDLKLAGTEEIAIAEVGGKTYLFVTGFDDDGISIFLVGSGGGLANVLNFAHGFSGSTSNLDRGHAITIGEVLGENYLFATGFFNKGIDTFRIANDGSLQELTKNNRDNKDNKNKPVSSNLGRAKSFSTAQVGGNTYLFATGSIPNAVSVFSVATNGALTSVDNVRDGERGAGELNGAHEVATKKIGEDSYLFVAGYADDGVSIFQINDDGKLFNLANVGDHYEEALKIKGTRAIATTTIAEIPYLFVVGYEDNGVSVFRMNIY